ncbi:hypothetical protein BJ165DRAFT_663525 [Panaeolus papilionaceus]|nr:hypothetical protein BJ165DRAFT_663525 [Panaeolus papilionaceus]
MWDLIWGENASRRAESNFTQLRDEIWKVYIEWGSNIVKFHNTQESALTILDGALELHSAEDYLLNDSISLPLRQTPFASNLHEDLQTQIQNLRLQQTNIQLDLQDVTVQSDEELKSILIPQLEETQTLLDKFEKELEEFGPAPSPPPIPKPAHAIPAPIAPAPTPSDFIPVSVAPKKGLFRRVINSAKRLEKKLHRNSNC